MTGKDRVEDLLRELAPQVLAVLVRRHGQFDACEDAVQEALLAAARQWPQEGTPERPRSWLLTVASRALIDAWRADSARRRREAMAALDLAAHPAGIPASSSAWSCRCSTSSSTRDTPPARDRRCKGQT